jgi:tryptophan synthase alpha chain
MNRVRTLFKRLASESRCGLIAYVTCGDPSVDTTVDIVNKLTEAGADAIELGVPFSDPIADGPVIQAASQRALAHGTSVLDVLAIAARVRATSETPLILFSYLNPLMRYGVERFAEDAAVAGIDAVLLTDLPPEAAGPIRAALAARQIGMIFLLAPTSTDARIKAIDRASDDFVYYVSTTGVTGTRRELDPALLGRLDEIRGRVKRKIAVGFGVSTHEHYELLRTHCDAVVVGSAIVRAIGTGEPDGAANRAGGVVRQILGSVS